MQYLCVLLQLINSKVEVTFVAMARSSDGTTAWPSPPWLPSLRANGTVSCQHCCSLHGMVCSIRGDNRPAVLNDQRSCLTTFLLLSSFTVLFGVLGGIPCTCKDLTLLSGTGCLQSTHLYLMFGCCRRAVVSVTTCHLLAGFLSSCCSSYSGLFSGSPS